MRASHLSPILAVLLAVAGCGGKNAPGTDKKPAVPTTLITATQARTESIELTEETVGSLESQIDPKVAAEVPGRITRMRVRAGEKVRRGQPLADLDAADLALQSRADAAEVKRLEALSAQQEKFAERQQGLVARGFLSRNAADDSLAQRDALREQLAAARARLEASGRNLGKASIVSPVDGFVESQIASVGDYLRVGDPVYRVVSNQNLRLHLAFPESAAPRLKPGQPVRLSSPQAPGKAMTGVVDDLRPSTGETNRALDVQVRFDNTAGLLGGGSVDAAVIVGRKDDAVVVPEQAVVLRPAGKVVYVIAAGKAAQRVVGTGIRKGGIVEIVKGLQAGETVAVDGAGFLTDGAPVTIQDKEKAPAPRS